MEKVTELCGLIRRSYKSEAEFARKLGWNRQRLNKITTGAKEPDIHEVAAISRGLGVPLDRMINIFLTAKSPNGQRA